MAVARRMAAGRLLFELLAGRCGVLVLLYSPLFLVFRGLSVGFHWHGDGKKYVDQGKEGADPPLDDGRGRISAVTTQGS